MPESSTLAQSLGLASFLSILACYPFLSLLSVCLLPFCLSCPSSASVLSLSFFPFFFSFSLVQCEGQLLIGLAPQSPEAMLADCTCCPATWHTLKWYASKMHAPKGMPPSSNFKMLLAATHDAALHTSAMLHIIYITTIYIHMPTGASFP